MNDTEDPLTTVSTNPRDVRVDYLQEIIYPVAVRNTSQVPILLDDGFLEFQTDHPDVTAQALRVSFPCNQRLEPGYFDYFRVAIRPNLLYRPSSNVFSANFRFRRQHPYHIGPVEHAAFDNMGYIIILDPPSFEQTFISFKDPEDDELSVMLCTMARRAGFTPYRAKDQREPGISDYWEVKIRPAIRSSKVTLALWTTRSFATDPNNVRRELQMSREAGTPVVLLRESNVEPPEEYPSRLVEHVLFDRSNPWVPFAEALARLAKRRHQSSGHCL